MPTRGKKVSEEMSSLVRQIHAILGEPDLITRCRYDARGNAEKASQFVNDCMLIIFLHTRLLIVETFDKFNSRIGLEKTASPGELPEALPLEEAQEFRVSIDDALLRFRLNADEEFPEQKTVIKRDSTSESFPDLISRIVSDEQRQMKESILETVPVNEYCIIGLDSLKMRGGVTDPSSKVQYTESVDVEDGEFEIEVKDPEEIGFVAYPEHPTTEFRRIETPEACSSKALEGTEERVVQLGNYPLEFHDDHFTDVTSRESAVSGSYSVGASGSADQLAGPKKLEEEKKPAEFEKQSSESAVESYEFLTTDDFRKQKVDFKKFIKDQSSPIPSREAESDFGKELNPQREIIQETPGNRVKLPDLIERFPSPGSTIIPIPKKLSMEDIPEEQDANEDIQLESSATKNVSRQTKFERCDTNIEEEAKASSRVTDTTEDPNQVKNMYPSVTEEASESQEKTESFPVVDDSLQSISENMKSFSPSFEVPTLTPCVSVQITSFITNVNDYLREVALTSLEERVRLSRLSDSEEEESLYQMYKTVSQSKYSKIVPQTAVDTNDKSIDSIIDKEVDVFIESFNKDLAQIIETFLAASESIIQKVTTQIINTRLRHCVETTRSAFNAIADEQKSTANKKLDKIKDCINIFQNLGSQQKYEISFIQSTSTLVDAVIIDEKVKMGGNLRRIIGVEGGDGSGTTSQQVQSKLKETMDKIKSEVEDYFKTITNYMEIVLTYKNSSSLEGIGKSVLRDVRNLVLHMKSCIIVVLGHFFDVLIDLQELIDYDMHKLTRNYACAINDMRTSINVTLERCINAAFV